ncbi:hypothetical protein GTQ34_01565 [Muricauda sp. JGD-17]|uniref:Surface layer protein A domain-containing protein n=1 Tax=Flagellimonas ochracea TaxID=2696472 RepID=A0A964WWA4_9FLAO|nr:DUF6515 family protein [Allomuricauda ochracea]NAY90593.1 hypothetical protein [Allomuricauda ochracea]
MKALKTLFISMALLAGMALTNAQTKVVHVYPKHGTVVTTISKPRVVVHQRTSYYVADGIWYRARGRKYVVCAAPAGFKVTKLPRAHRVVHVNGKRLYRYRGVWYKKRGRHFVVVTV